MSISYIETKNAHTVMCPTVGRDSKGNSAKCQGEYCAAWRYASMVESRPTGEPRQQSSFTRVMSDPEYGYCGLAGKPEHD